LILVLQADARPGGSGQGFHTMYVDLVGTVKTTKGEVRFTQTETNIKGIQGDPKRATDVAYSKAAEQIQKGFVPDLIQLWHGF
jgi:glycerol-3-phosphate responsive antiterminator